MPDSAREETSFSIAGGAGSVSYTLTEIAAAGAEVAALARLMDQVINELHSEWLRLSAAAAGSAPYPYGPLEAMAHAVWSARESQATAWQLSRKVAQAAEDYATAEAHATAHHEQLGKLSALQDGLGVWSWGVLAPLRLLAELPGWLRNNKNKGLRDGVEDLLNNGTAYAAGALGPYPGMVYLLSQLRPRSGSGVESALAVRSALDSMGLSRPGKLAMRRVPVTEWQRDADSLLPGADSAENVAGEPWAVEASISAMLAGTGDAYADPPGSIGVVQVVRPDGSSAWVVHLPGTEDWSTIDSKNPFDMEGNLEGLTSLHKEAYLQQHILIQDFIKEALAASGAGPRDEVLLTGHSGGGIHAAAAAADSDFLESVNVKMIVIAGAPAKNLPVSSDITVLDLQNDDDIVAALDFGAPPTAAHWVTATSQRPSLPGGTDLKTTVQEAHALENYLSDARALDVSDNPAILVSKQEIAAFLGLGVGAVGVGRKFVYQGWDVNGVAQSKETGRRRGKSVP